MSNGLVIKSYAPARIAATAVSRLPNAVTTTTGTIGPVGRDAAAQLDAAHPWHIQVGDDHVDGPLANRNDCVFRREPPGGGEALANEARRHQLAGVSIVIYDEDVRGHARSAVAGQGNQIVNRLPRPISLSTSIQPS